MNFLAHCLIAANASEQYESELVFGGYFGDFVKGKLDHLPGPIRQGVKLHRRIDAFSNQLPGIRDSCARFPADLRRFAPIYLDVVADHFLASQWHEFGTGELAEFTEKCYSSIATHSTWLDPDSQRLFEYARNTDLFARYANWPTIVRTLESISKRLKREHLNDALLSFLPTVLEALADDFELYVPQLMDHGKQWLIQERAS